MATQKTVTVTYHPKKPPNQQLQADPPTLTITEPDEWVLWTLSETSKRLLEYTQIFIHFDDRLGPFQAIRNVSPTHLVAKGNTGVKGIFCYSLALVSHLGQISKTPTLRSSRPFIIDNKCDVENTSPKTTVKYIPGSETQDGKPALEVHPPCHLLLHDGDIVLWHVENVPPDHHVAFQLHLDHFSSVSMFHTTESTRRFGAAIFKDATPQKLPYRVAVWDANGGEPVIKDPIIDGLGRPPGSGTGT